MGVVAGLERAGGVKHLQRDEGGVVAVLLLGCDLADAGDNLVDAYDSDGGAASVLAGAPLAYAGIVSPGLAGELSDVETEFDLVERVAEALGCHFEDAAADLGLVEQDVAPVVGRSAGGARDLVRVDACGPQWDGGWAVGDVRLAGLGSRAAAG